MELNQAFGYPRGWISIGVTLLSVALLSSCNSSKPANAPPNTKKIVEIPVEVASAIRGDISTHYATTAILEPKEEAYVVPRAQGIIQEIYVEEGDYVEKGQKLAQIEPRRYHLNVERAKANLSGLQKELDKVNKVYNKQLVSDDAYDKLTAQYQSAKASLSLAELDLKEATILAPISGFIAERNAKVGNLTESFQRSKMFHIVQQKELYGIVHLPEKELSNVHPNQAAVLTLSAFEDYQTHAFVKRISPVINAETGTFKVTLRVPNHQNKLKAGMFAQVKLNYNTHKDSLLIPRRALLAQGDGNQIFLVKDGLATRAELELGYQENEYVEILGGLSGDEKIVITGQQNLKNNSPVTIINLAPPSINSDQQAPLAKG